MCVANFIRIAFTVKKVMAVSCSYVTMFLDFSASVSTGAREHGAGEGSIGASSRGQEAPWMG